MRTATLSTYTLGVPGRWGSRGPPSPLYTVSWYNSCIDWVAVSHRRLFNVLLNEHLHSVERNEMKHTKTLSTIGNAIATWANTEAAQTVSRKALIKQAGKLSLPEKQRVDGELVAYYAEKAGVAVKEREKAHALFCGSVPEWALDAKGRVTHPASMALSRARGILYFQEKAGKAPRKAGATTPAAKVKAATVAQVLSFAEAQFTRKEAGERFSKEEKSEFRRAAQMLLALIA